MYIVQMTGSKINSSPSAIFFKSFDKSVFIIDLSAREKGENCPILNNNALFQDFESGDKYLRFMEQ